MTRVLLDIGGALLLLMLFLGIVTFIESATRAGRLPAESARKSIHVAGGLGCLLLPILVHLWITVLCLAVALSIALHFGEHHGLLRSLGSVKRKSYGALLFPIAILFLFIVSQGKIWLYVSALLVLVLADTAAALAGTRFGRICYKTTPDERKSLEGTLMFALVGFLCVYLSLLTLSDIPHMTCLLTALLMAALLAMLEAVSIGGTDNIIVPLGTCFLLMKVPTKPLPEILFQCISLFIITTILLLLNRRTRTFHTRTLIIFILTVYSTWALGSLDWIIPVGVGFFIYNWICAPCEALPEDLTARRMLRPMYPLLIILFTANALMAFDFWFGPFIAATACTTSLCIASRYRRDQNMSGLSGSRLWTTLLLPSTLSLILCLPVHGMSLFAVMPIMVPLCVGIPLLYLFLKHSSLDGFPWGYVITIHTSAAALIYASLQQLNVVTPLQPLTWMEVFR